MNLHAPLEAPHDIERPFNPPIFTQPETFLITKFSLIFFVGPAPFLLVDRSPNHKITVAQMAERVAHDLKVVGSNSAWFLMRSFFLS